jgi:hypothetical protein
LGRAILLGLEFLVIADIIGTVAVEPTLHNLGVLAVIGTIRTLLSFALELEVSGRWPWQKQQSARAIDVRQGSTPLFMAFWRQPSEEMDEPVDQPPARRCGAADPVRADLSIGRRAPR